MYREEDIKCKFYDMTKALEAGVVDKVQFAIGKRICTFILEGYNKYLYKQGSKTLDPGIMATKGDITQYPAYQTLEYSIKTLAKTLPATYKRYVKILQDSLTIIKGHKKLFMKGFSFKNGSVAIIYGAWVQGLFDGTSLLITEQVAQSGKGKDYSPSKILLNNELFNTMEQLVDTFKAGKGVIILKNLITMSKGKTVAKESVIPALLLIGTVISGIIVALILVRNIIFFFYIKRTQLSEYLRLQAEYLKEHEVEVKHSKEFSNDEKKNIIATQRKWEDRLLNIAEFIRVEDVRVNKELKPKIDQADEELNAKFKEESQDSASYNNVEKLDMVDTDMNFL